MNSILVEDLEEGEIADDVVIEPVVEKKVKLLPRRYNLSDKSFVSKHKKYCKHSNEHSRRKSDTFHKNSKIHRKHRKACPKHSKLSFKKSKHFEESSLDIIDLKPQFSSPIMAKCAFKNFMSPPRKVSKVENASSIFQSPSVSKDSINFSKLLAKYKKSKDDRNKLKNIDCKKNESPMKILNNKNESPVKILKGNKDSAIKILNGKNESPIKILNLENEIPTKILNGKNESPTKTLNRKSDMSHNRNHAKNSLEKSLKFEDDEDEEELRRLALATCLKRPVTSQETYVTNSKISSSTSLLPVMAMDNYEVVDMEMGNSDSENLDAENNLYIIDTTPAYYCDLNQNNGDEFNSNFVNDCNLELQNQGFLPNINIHETLPNFATDTFCQEVNDLYSNFETENASISTNQIDEEFEEELLRAELIANMNSVRQKNKYETVVNEKVPIIKSVSIEDEICHKENIFNDETLSIKQSTDLIENNFDERIVNIINPKNEIIGKDERTVSIVSDVNKKENIFNDKTRSVTAIYSKAEFPNVSPLRKSVDIKVKLNNVQSNNVVSTNKVILPQERIIISLNNDSSSDDDDSDQEDNSLKSLPEKNPSVASLDALISSARHESDGIKDNASNSNGSSDAISWLSKAQQEQYNNLKKILDAKKQQPLPKSPPTVIPNVVKSQNSELNLLKKQLFIAEKNLEKEKVILKDAMKEVHVKKQIYMKSKEKFLEYKQRLHEALIVKNLNLKNWSKCANNFRTLKKSVSKRSAIINDLQTKIDSLLIEFQNDSASPLSSHTIDHNYNINL